MTENLNQTIIQLVQKELSDYRPKQLATVLNLLNEGNTVPFIARYRKEMTGSLDEVQIREIEERYAYLENLEKRKTEVIRLIDEQGKLTPELEAEITQAVKMQQVEDLYRPYKQKRRTKATIAKEKGLEPLAKWLMQLTDGEVQSEAEKYIDKEKKSLLPKKRCTVLMRLLLNKSAIMQNFGLGFGLIRITKVCMSAMSRMSKQMKKAYMKCIMTLQNPSIKWFLIEY